jgi:NAD(P)-dependent dehydrogenase (short-subunit alcohol dehydrogenase family)
MNAKTNGVMLVTGATDGIGFHTALALAQQGLQVLVHGRSEAKANDAVSRLKQAGAEAVAPVWADLSSMRQVRALADQVHALAPALDGLVNNAGVFMTEASTTEDGFEATVGINHLAPFLLTHALLPSLSAARSSRVVNVSSVAHARGRVEVRDVPVPRHFEGYAAYASSKLMNVLFTHELARRLSAKGLHVTVAALHPGVITTKLLQKGFGMGGATVQSGAQTSVFCATAKSLEGVTGRYFSDSREVSCAPHATDPALERALYEKSCELVGCAPI